jgi:hypothetical protein
LSYAEVACVPTRIHIWALVSVLHIHGEVSVSNNEDDSRAAQRSYWDLLCEVSVAIQQIGLVTGSPLEQCARRLLLRLSVDACHEEINSPKSISFQQQETLM